MSSRPSLKVEKRKIFGRKLKQLRREGMLPANIFGKKVKSLAVFLPLQDFQKVFSQVGETGLVDLQVKGETKSRPCLISNTHISPVSDLPLHADFHQVDLTQKVTANVPVQLVGESPAVKDKGAVLITLFDEIEVEALPTDLPDKFSLDISGLKEFNDAILAKDLKVDHSKVTIKMADNESIVMVQEPKEEEAAPAPAEEEAPEAEAETTQETEAAEAKTQATKEKPPEEKDKQSGEKKAAEKKPTEAKPKQK